MSNNSPIPPDPGSWATGSFAESRSLKRRLLQELTDSHEHGQPLKPEDLLPRWPNDLQSRADIASLLFEDFQQRQAKGELPEVSDYEQRFPEHKDQFTTIIRRRDLLFSLGGGSDTSVPRLALPAVGDELFGFRLCGQLGTGAFARVFLAEQVSLADRPVVLKTSDLTGDEPQTLAQLQHTHIVPIHSVHEDQQAGLRAVCMPYFGGASLSDVLRSLWQECQTTGKGEQPERGEQLVDALERTQSPLPQTTGWQNDDQAPVNVLRRLNYARAAAWIVARLAEGLQHAHLRGVLHRDIKPSNILLGADGQPMLLDFNLASKKRANQAHETIGGTVAYMSPEHLRALAARSHSLAEQVDHRSDVYSLGMVLFEALTGHNPFDQSGSYSPVPVVVEAMAVERGRSAPSARQHRGDLPWTLESILRKCLAPQPTDRYQRAEHLAEDLRRFLDDRPLKYAPELSWKECASKWRRRHPRVTTLVPVVGVAVLLLATVITILVAVHGRLTVSEQSLVVAETQEKKQLFQQGTVRALMLVNAVTDLQDHARQGLVVCEKTLSRFGILQRDDWQQHPHWQRLEPDEQKRLAEDARELLLQLASARVRLSPGDQTALRDALAQLDRAERIDGLTPTPALLCDRAMYLRALGEETAAASVEQQARDMKPNSARDHYLLAASHIRQGGTRNAGKSIEELNRAIALNPQYYWAWCQRGIVHQNAGDYHLAAADFGVCVGLWPDFVWGHFNLGCAHGLGGRSEDALRAYTTALKCDAQFADAHVNRGLLLVDLKRFKEALSDFARATELGCDGASLHTGRGVALEALAQTQEADAAFERAFAHLSPDSPVKVKDRVRCSYGFAVYRRLPDNARQAFESVLEGSPQYAEALYGRAMIAVEREQADEAIGYLDQVIALAPNRIDARRQRAVQLARRGKFAEAFEAINWCLVQKEPRPGPTFYAAASVAAHAAEKSSGKNADILAERALLYLRQALMHGYGRDIAENDPDLAGIREHPDFRRLINRPAPFESGQAQLTITPRLSAAPEGRFGS